MVVDVGPALPHPGDGRHRPGPARLLLSARARRRHRGDRRHPRPRGPSRRPPVGAARARAVPAGLRRPADDGDGALEARGAQAARGRAHRHRRRRRDRRRPVHPRAHPHDPFDPGRQRGGADERARDDPHHRRLQVRPDPGRRRAGRHLPPGGARSGGRAPAVRRLDQRRPARLLALGVRRRPAARGVLRPRGGPHHRDELRLQHPPRPAGGRRRRGARAQGRARRALDAQERHDRPPARPHRRARGAHRRAAGDRGLPRPSDGDPLHRLTGRAALRVAAHGLPRPSAGQPARGRHRGVLGDPGAGQRAGGGGDHRPPVPHRLRGAHDPPTRRSTLPGTATPRS